jgi:hypothetical protein
MLKADGTTRNIEQMRELVNKINAANNLEKRLKTKGKSTKIFEARRKELTKKLEEERRGR